MEPPFDRRAERAGDPPIVVPGANSAAAAAPLPRTSSAGRVIRASDRERDEAVRLLRSAFEEGRLGDDEFGERMRLALSARTRGDLGRLLSDLPDADPARRLRLADQPAEGPADGRFAVAVKGSVSRRGRWRVPHRLTTFAYKGVSYLDMRSAELSAMVTVIRAVGYKSIVQIIVPPSVRVVAGGFGVSRDSPVQEVPPDAPVLHVRGFAYKGRIEIRTRPQP